MRKWLILMSLWTLGASAAPVWTWTDADGQVHYSDRPVPGARQIEVGTATTPARPMPAAPQARDEARSTSAARAARSARYRTFVVVSPKEQETLWNIGSTLSVELLIDPQLVSGHRIDVLLDGQRRNLDTTALQFTLPDVFRGVHTLQAVIVDAQGELVMQSSPVTFVVQQTTIFNPNNPNNPNAPQRRAPSGG